MKKTNEALSLKIFIKTFGCQMNEYDSTRIENLFKLQGYKRALSYDDATVILLNTCTVRRKAEDKIYSELGRIKKIKQKMPDLTLGVIGCLAQQEGQKLIDKYPYIDLVCGTKTLLRIVELVQIARSGKKVVNIGMDLSDDIYPHNLYSPVNNQISAFVTIMQGCNNYCAYCIVPYVRGPEWSRKPTDIVNEIKHLTQYGIKEVTLLGQNVNSYGKTLTPKTNFSELLFMLDKIDGLERIRFTTSHPKDLSQDLIKSFKHNKKLCEHIHLPLQSGSNKILNQMNRGYRREEYVDKIAALREIVPSISITSDVIVGFPGETDRDFNETCSLIEDIHFDDLFIFHYTPRIGTQASRCLDNLPYTVKLKRLKKLNELQQAISLTVNAQLVGETVSVLFEECSKKGTGTIAGRTRTNKVVNCQASLDIIGTTSFVKIEKAHIHSLTGSLLTNEVLT
jgi:tRNA-2-methylthio-N6-dimethylallyladenosine synthase